MIALQANPYIKSILSKKQGFLLYSREEISEEQAVGYILQNLMQTERSMEIMQKEVEMLKKEVAMLKAFVWKQEGKNGE